MFPQRGYGFENDQRFEYLISYLPTYLPTEYLLRYCTIARLVWRYANALRHRVSRPMDNGEDRDPSLGAGGTELPLFLFETGDLAD